LIYQQNSQNSLNPAFVKIPLKIASISIGIRITSKI